MNHIEFIEKHVREELLRLGFSLGKAGASPLIDFDTNQEKLRDNSNGSITD